MGPQSGPGNRDGTRGASLVGGALFWSAWILGLLIAFALLWASFVALTSIMDLLMYGEGDHSRALVELAGWVFGVQFAVFLAVAGWAGGKIAARLRMIPARWWAPSAIAAAAWFLLIAAYWIPSYVIRVGRYGHLGIYLGHSTSVLAGYYDGLFLSLLRELALFALAYLPLLAGQAIARRNAAASAAPTAPSHPAGHPATVEAASARHPAAPTSPSPPPPRQSPATRAAERAQAEASLLAHADSGVSRIREALEPADAGLWRRIDLDRLLSLKWWLAVLVGVYLVTGMLKNALTAGFTIGLLIRVAQDAALMLGVIAVIYIVLPKPRRRPAAAVSLGDEDRLLEGTRTTLNSVALAAGGRMPELLFIDSPGPNAYIGDARRSTFDTDPTVQISVTRGFLALPVDEQEAGFALLYGRRRVEARGHWEQPVFRLPGERPNPMAASTWIDVAERGDREGLLILKDPQPVLRLLARLARVDTSVKGFDFTDAPVFGYLAWPGPMHDPSLDDTKRTTAETPGESVNAEALRLEAIQRVTAAMGWSAMAPAAPTPAE